MCILLDYYECTAAEVDLSFLVSFSMHMDIGGRNRKIDLGITKPDKFIYPNCCIKLT